MAQPLGYTPDEVRAMSWFDFSCVVDGFEQANGGGKPAAPTDEEDDALRAKYG